MGKNAGEGLKGERWSTMIERVDEDRAMKREKDREARRKGDRGMEIVTAVEGKYEGMLEKRGEREAHGERRLWREGGGSMRTG